MSFKLLEECLESHTVSGIAKKLNIVSGTVNRWILLKDVPSNYEFDLLKILGKNIDYSEYTHKSKDQFFTPQGMAKKCIDTFFRVTGVNPDEYTFIEPSAGDGSFFNALSHKKIGIDIEPRCDGVSKLDFLGWTPPDTSLKYVVIGNPPFGLRGHMALRFINHSEFADYVCFILPQLFESDGKGVPRKRVQGFNLIYSEKVDSTFNYPDGREVGVNCIFQIWSKNHESPANYKLEDNDSKEVKIYSLSDGGTPSSTRNKKMFDKCDVYLPSTCFGREKMRYYEGFRELPGCRGYGIVFLKDREAKMMKSRNINWSEVAFLSTNGAYNLRSSQIIKEFKQ